MINKNNFQDDYTPDAIWVIPIEQIPVNGIRTIPCPALIT